MVFRGVEGLVGGVWGCGGVGGWCLGVWRGWWVVFGGVEGLVGGVWGC